MSNALKKLAENGLSLPKLETPAAKFKPYVVSQNMVYISGQLPLGFGDISQHVGQVGKDMDIAQAKEVAKIVGLNILYRLNEACSGDMDKVKRCVKLTVFVNSAPNFNEHPAIANEISELMLLAFDERGQHARSAIGVAQLPFGVAVEAEAIFEI